jgi:hypothetical protein
VNVGQGAFQVTGVRGSFAESEITSITQQVLNSEGGQSSVSTPATMYFAGDGHNHWHIRDLESYELSRLDNGVKVGTSLKSGICFADNHEYRLTLLGAPPDPVYRSCGKSSSLRVLMGLSIAGAIPIPGGYPTSTST